MRTTLLACLCLGLASLAVAQDKVDVKWHCAPVTTQQKFDVGDMPGHAMGVAQGTCTATSSSLGEKSGAWTETQNLWPKKAATHGTFVVTTDNGDKIYYAYTGDQNLTAMTGVNKFKVAGGTGKYKSAKGEGSCPGTFNKDGSSDWTCSGTFSQGQ
jgi:hypothetical protein